MDTPRKALTGTVLSDLFGNTWPQKASQLPYTTFLETRLPPLRPSTPLPQDSWYLSRPSVRPTVSSPREDPSSEPLLQHFRRNQDPVDLCVTPFLNANKVLPDVVLWSGACNTGVHPSLRTALGQLVRAPVCTAV